MKGQTFRRGKRALYFFYLIALNIVSGVLPSHAQDTTELTSSYTHLEAAIGIERYAVRDEYLSQSRYVGVMNRYGLSLEKGTSRRINNFDVVIRDAKELETDDLANLTARVLNLTVRSAQLHLVSESSFLGITGKWYLGAGSGIDFYGRAQNVALGGRLSDELISLMLTVPVNIHTRIDLPLSKRTKWVTEAGFSVFTLGVRSDIDNDFKFGAYTLFKQFDGWLNTALLHNLSSRLTLGLILQNRFIRATGWDQPVISAGTGLTGSLIFRLKKTAQ